MIRSKKNTFGYWLFMIIGSFFFLIFLLWMVNKLLNFHGLQGNDAAGEQTIGLMAILFGFFSILMIFTVSFFTRTILIDTAGKSIVFRNAVTRQQRIYQFSEFNGFVEILTSHKSSKTETIGFVQGKKTVHKIDSFWYSNYKELKGAIETMLPRLP